MVVWKLKKLLPGVTADLSVVFRDMPPVAGERRLLVAAAPAETLHSVEQAFDAAGVRVGALAPASLALFEGLAPTLAARSAGDYALVHRSPGSLVFVIARESAPLFFRQRPVEAEDGDHEQEVRLSLSYYAEKLKGPGLAASYFHDALVRRGSARRPVGLSETAAAADRRTPRSRRRLRRAGRFPARAAAGVRRRHRGRLDGTPAQLRAPALP